MHEWPYRVAILCGDHVIATSGDESTVRFTASLIARHPDTDPDPVFIPITEGQQIACEMVALGAV